MKIYVQQITRFISFSKSGWILKKHKQPTHIISHKKPPSKHISLLSYHKTYHFELDNQETGNAIRNSFNSNGSTTNSTLIRLPFISSIYFFSFF